MKKEIFNQNGKKLEKTVEVSDKVFASEVNDAAIAHYVYVYLSNQREGNANTKDRSEVSGGGKKPYRQKGTGRARAGSSRSPLWRKGGVTFGPTNAVNWKKKITKKQKLAALKSAFSKMISENKLTFIDSVDFDTKSPLTKQAAKFSETFSSPKKFSVVLSSVNKNVVKAFSNLPEAKVIYVKDLNVYDVLTAGTLFMDEKSVEYINSKVE